ncbi:MAG TPA: hypothetical protein VMU90_04405 [Solirubrobacteraceae bacterium]|nr:hypothetical protein [Solirubrobacteraceae bacterium]
MPALAHVTVVAASWLAAAQPGGLSSNEEAPPSTLGLWIGLGMLAAVVLVVGAGIRYHHRRQLRAASILPDDPFAVEAMRACVELFCELEPGRALRGEPRVDGPVGFAYLGAADPGETADGRAVVRVQGRLRPPSRQVSISRGQRNWLLGLAAAILIAAFVGLALAPATTVRSAGPTTISLRDGVALGGIRQLSYRTGALIDLTVRSDVAGEVHLHGYDIHRDVGPGHPAHFLVRATIEGSYPVELEGPSQTLAQLTVQR